MIYITGDMHGDMRRFDDTKIRKLKKDDSLIICGDFGFLWNDELQEQKFIKKLTEKKFNILFLDGVHENYDLLSAYPLTEWNGGKVRSLGGNLYHLLRGQVFTLEDKKIFTFGGGDSDDRHMRQDADKWWPNEMPSLEEMSEGIQNLNRVNMAVDYVITHSPAPRMNTLKGLPNRLDKNQLEMFFEQIEKNVKFRKWFFGSLHLDRKITSTYYAVFNNILSANGHMA